ncbi:MAG: DUF1294 domain-containing protein [Planctomycetaceae bacterium]
MPRPPDLINLVAWLAAIWLAAVVVLLALAFWHPSVQMHWTNLVYLGATTLFSLIVFGAMGLDKYRAGTGGRRIPEAVLHTLELLGGWPGSLLAQRSFRHKNRKLAYQAVFWAIVAIHVVLLAWTAWLWWTMPASEPPPVPDIVIEPATD